jgi:putative ABC transport system permease protein
VTGWRTALRVARREARRARGRSVLVVAMIALPVATLAFGLVVTDTFKLTAAEQADRLMGAGQAVAIWPQRGPVQQEPDYLAFYQAGFTPQPAARTEPTTQDLLALLPPGSRAVPDRAGHLSVHTAAGVGTVNARMLDYADPLARGILRPLSGRAPAAADEVALTPSAASRIGTGLGGTVRLADGGRAFRVVGTVEDPADLRTELLVLRPGALSVAAPHPGLASADPQSERWLVDTPGRITWDQVKRLNTSGVVAVSRYVLAHMPSAAERYSEVGSSGGGPTLAIVVLVGGMALLEIVLLAGPAFAVGARRRRRDLALVAAAGGTPAHLRRIVLADGVVLGTLAAGAGLLAGVAVAAAGRPLLENLSHSRSGGFRVFPVALAGLAAVAVLTGLLAALVPAWTASRQDVVTALAGRRGITRSRRLWLFLGAGLAAAGAGLAAAGAWRTNATVILTGLAVAELGLVLCTPSIVGLVARAGRRLPLAPRIALRDTSRNRTAAAPAISAVMAAVVGSLAVGVVFLAETRRAHDDYRTLSQPGQVSVINVARGKPVGPSEPISPQVAAALREAMPVRQVTQLGTLVCADTLCLVGLRMPPATACPYTGDVLRREPSAAEQRAARRDSRCDGVGAGYRYFGVFDSARATAVVVEESGGAAVAGVPAGDVAAVTAALHSGAAVVNDPRYLDGGRVRLSITQVRPDGRRGSERTETAPGFALPHPVAAPFVMMTAAAARSLGLEQSPFVTLATTSRVPTQAEQDRLQALLGDDYVVEVERGAPEPNVTALVVMAIVAGVITLGAAAIATGLAAADGRADLSTLAAVGGSPRVRRILSLSQSGVIAGLGSLLGVAAGLGASVAVLYALNQRYAAIWPAPTPYPITVPWLNLGVALVVVPLIAMLGAGLLTRSRLPIERRRT